MFSVTIQCNYFLLCFPFVARDIASDGFLPFDDVELFQSGRSIGSKSSHHKVAATSAAAAMVLPAYYGASEVVLKPPVPAPRRTSSGREVRGGRMAANSYSEVHISL